MATKLIINYLYCMSIVMDQDLLVLGVVQTEKTLSQKAKVQHLLWVRVG